MEEEAGDEKNINDGKKEKEKKTLITVTCCGLERRQQAPSQPLRERKKLTVVPFPELLPRLPVLVVVLAITPATYSSRTFGRGFATNTLVGVGISKTPTTRAPSSPFPYVGCAGAANALYPTVYPASSASKLLSRKFFTPCSRYFLWRC